MARKSTKITYLDRDLVAELLTAFGTIKRVHDELRPRDGYEVLRRAIEGDPVSKEYADYLRACWKLYQLENKSCGRLFHLVAALEGRSPPLSQLWEHAAKYLAVLLELTGGSPLSTELQASLFRLTASARSSRSLEPLTLAKGATRSPTKKRSSRSRRRRDPKEPGLANYSRTR